MSDGGGVRISVGGLILSGVRTVTATMAFARPMLV